MRPDQLELVNQPTSLSVHPDATWAVVALSRPSFAADAYVGQLWRVPLSGSGQPRRITRGQSDSAPRFSPDGRMIGFLRPDADGHAQVHVVESAGGEPVQLTDQHLGVSEFTFSPDSRQIAFTARVADPGRYGSLDGVSASQEDPRRVTGYQFRLNGAGYLTDKRKHLFVTTVAPLDVEPWVTPVGRVAEQLAEAAKKSGATEPSRFPKARQLTAGNHDAAEPAFSDDGLHILYTSALHDDRDQNLVTDIFEVPVEGGEPVSITPGRPMSFAKPVVSGQSVFALGEDLGESGHAYVGAQVCVHVLRPDGAQALGDPDATTHNLFPGGPDHVLAITQTRGIGVLHRLGPDGSDVEIPSAGSVHEAAAIPGSPDVLVIRADDDTVGEVVRLGPLGDATVLTDFGRRLREETAPVPPIELISASSDGYPVHGWAFVPATTGPHPVLLLIHGGPASAYGPAWFDEAQVYVSAGYAVVMCNPRGSEGYGAAHTRAIQGDFGNRDMADVISFLDHALATVPGLDADRVGVMGGSYGGYLTAWIIGNDQTHGHHWRGAIVERGYLDPWSFVGASDIGWSFPFEYNLRPGEDADKARLDAQSPMLRTDLVTTPTLVIHSENDLRCPLSQGLQYYTQLKRHGVETEMLIFPGENHELSRSGTPWHRRQRFEAILSWWQRLMPTQARESS